jgi:hypothetical protein
MIYEITIYGFIGLYSTLAILTAFVLCLIMTEKHTRSLQNPSKQIACGLFGLMGGIFWPFAWFIGIILLFSYSINSLANLTVSLFGKKD